MKRGRHGGGDGGERSSRGGAGGSAPPPLAPSHTPAHKNLRLLSSGGALADAILGRGDLGPEDRHPPQVARERRDALAPVLTVHGKVREPVDTQRLDGGAHLGRGLAVDRHEVDVRVVRGELPEFRGQRAARRAGWDVKLEHRQAGGGGV